MHVGSSTFGRARLLQEAPVKLRALRRLLPRQVGRELKSIEVSWAEGSGQQMPGATSSEEKSNLLTYPADDHAGETVMAGVSGSP